MSESGSSSTSDETIMKKSQSYNGFEEFIEFINSPEVSSLHDGFGTMFGFNRKFNVRAFRKNIKERVQNDEDIAFLVKMFIEHGNKVDKIINTPYLSEETSKRFMLLTEKFNIREKATGNTRDVITLSRLAISFPDVVAGIFEANPNIPGPISVEEIRLVSGHSEFPSLAREPILACFLPKNHAESHNMLNVFFLAKMMFTEIINQKSESWRQLTKLQRASNTRYYQIKAFDSPLCSEAVRKSWCIRLKIMEGNDYTAVWKQAAVKSRAKLENDYGADVTF